MTKEKININTLPTLNVGIVGHIDHGKTTLLQRLSGKWTDTHSEELKRGITIKLGYSDIIIRKSRTTYNIKSGEPVRYITFIDAPGHEMLMATMLSGAAMIDAAILVIAANEGIKPQTREHLIALQTKNIKNIIIVQNKIDLIDKKQALINYKQIKEFIKGTIAANAPIIPCSAQQGINIDKILEALVKIPIPKRDLSSNPIFIVARSFDINKPGTDISNLKGGVLGGTLKQGTLSIGQEIEIKPGLSLKKENKLTYNTVRTKITGIYQGTYPTKKATPGASLALETELDPTLTKTDTLSGTIASLPASLPEITSEIKVKFSLFKQIAGTSKHEKIENIKPSELLMLSVNTSITVGLVKKIDSSQNTIELSLRIPIVPFQGESIGIARNIEGHWRLIGWGKIV